MPGKLQGIRKEIRNKWQEAFTKEDTSKIGAFFSFFSSLFVGYYRVVLAKVYLRNCSSGSWVSIYGKPMIRSKGEITIGNRVRIWSVFSKARLLTIKGSKITIGDNSRINGAHISARTAISIGKNVRIAPYTIIIDSDFHNISDHFSPGESKPIVIGDNVWIAVGCTILKGVTIGKGSVIAAGSVVTKDVKENAVYGGVPAKFIKNT